MGLRLLFLLLATFVAVSSAGLLETLLSWDLPSEAAQGRSSTPQSKCLCQTSSCLCCVDLNLTSTIDLGGPACVNIKQKEQNVSLNLSYGDNPVHNATTKLANAANKPTCMNLLAELAQLCARFTSMKQSEAGYDGCLAVEPALLGSPQASYHIGCFNFNQSVRQVEASQIVESPASTEAPEEEEETGINTDELLAAVSASAEQGIALFSQWLGLTLNPKSNQSRESQTTQQVAERPSNGSSRSSRMMAETEEKDERFKQLLSAQDNILKESATIGQSDGAHTTFIYSKPIEPEKPVNSPKKVQVPAGDLAVVPRESRRGGRAYNIHQHVNEV